MDNGGNRMGSWQCDVFFLVGISDYFFGGITYIMAIVGRMEI